MCFRRSQSKRDSGFALVGITARVYPLRYCPTKCLVSPPYRGSREIQTLSLPCPPLTLGEGKRLTWLFQTHLTDNFGLGKRLVLPYLGYN